ncbi:MAG: hypothetical protein ACXWNI_01355 [Candidatus Limnocylindrales bacterium]
MGPAFTVAGVIGRGLAVGLAVGLGVGVGVAIGVAIADGVGVGVGVGVSVGVANATLLVTTVGLAVVALEQATTASVKKEIEPILARRPVPTLSSQSSTAHSHN